jgi:glycerol-3-phosphate O-acyltransferase
MMQPTRSLMQRKKNLLIAFDAFGTLFHPRVPVAEQYRAVSREHGINLPTELSKINAAFGDAWKSESTEHPNFGKAAGIGPEKWWGNVSILFVASPYFSTMKSWVSSKVFWLRHVPIRDETLAEKIYLIFRKRSRYDKALYSKLIQATRSLPSFIVAGNIMHMGISGGVANRCSS